MSHRSSSSRCRANGGDSTRLEYVHDLLKRVSIVGCPAGSSSSSGGVDWTEARLPVTYSVALAWSNVEAEKAGYLTYLNYLNGFIDHYDNEGEDVKFIVWMSFHVPEDDEDCRPGVLKLKENERVSIIKSVDANEHAFFTTMKRLYPLVDYDESTEGREVVVLDTHDRFKTQKIELNKLRIAMKDKKSDFGFTVWPAQGPTGPGNCKALRQITECPNFKLGSPEAWHWHFDAGMSISRPQFRKKVKDCTAKTLKEFAETPSTRLNFDRSVEEYIIEAYFTSNPTLHDFIFERSAVRQHVSELRASTKSKPGASDIVEQCQEVDPDDVEFDLDAKLASYLKKTTDVEWKLPPRGRNERSTKRCIDAADPPIPHRRRRGSASAKRSASSVPRPTSEDRCIDLTTPPPSPQALEPSNVTRQRDRLLSLNDSSSDDSC